MDCYETEKRNYLKVVFSDFRVRENNPTPQTAVISPGRDNGLNGGLAQIRSDCRTAWLPRSRAGAVPLKSSPVQTRYAPLAAASGFTLDRAIQSSP